MTLFASDPATFNDPFEVRPAFDQERHDFYANGHETFYAKRTGFKNSLLGNRSMVGIPVENAVGFGENINKQFREELSRKYRVLSLCQNPHNTLMWGHYTKSKEGVAHAGLVLGINVSCREFPSGIKADGYVSQRQRCGYGVPQNYIEAYKWFNLAAAQGDTNAIQGRNVIVQFMTPEQIAEGQQLSGAFAPQEKSSHSNSSDFD